MKIHEYQGKEILRQYGVAVPNGRACFSVDEAVAAAEAMGVLVDLALEDTASTMGR